MGPKDRNTGTEFQEQIDRLFRGEEQHETEEAKEDEAEGDKKREAE